MNAFRIASLARLISSSVIGSLERFSMSFFDRQHRLDRSLTLRPHRDLSDAGVPEVRSDPAPHAVG